MFISKTKEENTKIIDMFNRILDNFVVSGVISTSYTVEINYNRLKSVLKINIDIDIDDVEKLIKFLLIKYSCKVE